MCPSFATSCASSGARTHTLPSSLVANVRSALHADAAALLAAHSGTDFTHELGEYYRDSALSLACARVDVLMVRVLLEGGVSAAACLSPDFEPVPSTSMLFFAAGFSNHPYLDEQALDRPRERIEILRLLIAGGASPAHGAASVQARLATSTLIARALAAA